MSRRAERAGQENSIVASRATRRRTKRQLTSSTWPWASDHVDNRQSGYPGILRLIRSAIGFPRLEAAGAGAGTEAEWEAVGGLDHLEGQDVEADNSLDRADDLVDDRVQRDQLVLGDEHAVAWQ
jgi:hypothetical protein